MENKKVRYIIAFAVIMISLVVYSFMASNGSTSSSDIKKAKSWEDVKAYQYEHTPGLKRAEKYGLTREYDMTVKIPNTSYELTIDEIWYNETGGIPILSFEYSQIVTN